MPTLTPREYDAAERIALTNMPNRIVECVQTVIFNQNGYPTRVGTDKELVRYAEAIAESGFEERFDVQLEGFTPEEFDQWQAVWAKALEFTDKSFNRLVLPRSSLIAGMNVWRHIKYLYGEQRPRTLEVGPGSGHFGALLQIDDFPYAATDITQAFYLVQNHYWNSITNDGVVELAYGGDPATAFANLAPGAPVHIPWWVFKQLLPDTPPQFDLVVCNHALCEMHDWSCRYFLELAKQALQGQPHERKLFVFEGWGWSAPHDRERVLKLFLKNDFRMVHHDLLIAVFALEGSNDAVHCCGFPQQIQEQTAILNDQGGLELVTQVRESYAPIFYENELNPVSKAITDGRRALEPRRVIKRDQIETLATALLQTEDHRTDDEKFWGLIGMAEHVGSADPTR